MTGILRRWFGRKDPGADLPPPEAPEHVHAVSGASIRLPDHFQATFGLPVCDWRAIDEWIRALPEEARKDAWGACERAWLLHLRDALGPIYRLDETETAILVSALDRRMAAATLEFMSRTARRIGMVLDGIVEVPAWGKDVLVVFEDEDRYYEYVSHYYPDAGEYALSGGMHINYGCGHFITVRRDMRAVEPVIAHEMTHSFLSHLPIPAWLNEGIAVNTEHRLCGAGAGLSTPAQMHAQHLAYWGEDEVQEFWLGKSFLRTDQGNRLSYDLARILVDQFSRDWIPFRDFVLAADSADAGQAAAKRFLGCSLGTSVAAILETLNSDGMEPDPECWGRPPERGAFCPPRSCAPTRSVEH